MFCCHFEGQRSQPVGAVLGCVVWGRRLIDRWVRHRPAVDCVACGVFLIHSGFESWRGTVLAVRVGAGGAGAGGCDGGARRGCCGGSGAAVGPAGESGPCGNGGRGLWRAWWESFGGGAGGGNGRPCGRRAVASRLWGNDVWVGHRWGALGLRGRIGWRIAAAYRPGANTVNSSRSATAAPCAGGALRCEGCAPR